MAVLVEIADALRDVADGLGLQLEDMAERAGVRDQGWGQNEWLALVKAVHTGVSPTLGEGAPALVALIRTVSDLAPGNEQLKKLQRRLDGSG